MGRKRNKRDPTECGGDHAGMAPAPLSKTTVCGLLALLVAVVFGQTLRHAFVDYDDYDYVCDNPQVAAGFTGQGFAWAFTHFHSNNWHPLAWLSHALDCQFYGLSYPGGHHLSNVLLHAASTILLFLVLRRMTGGLWPSAGAAALFAIHPLHVESVAWVAERKDVLSGLFCMLTFWFYARYAERPASWGRYLLVIASFALGLMAKPMLVTLPFVLLLLDYWPLGRAGSRRAPCTHGRGAGGHHVPMVGEQAGTMYPWSGSRNPQAPIPHFPRSLLPLVVEKIPLFVLAAISCVVTYSAQGTAITPLERLPLGVRTANALLSYVAYLVQFFYPVGLAVFYPRPKDPLPIWYIFAAVLLLVGISLAVLACRRKCPYLLVGWLWYLGMLVPVIGLVQVGSQTHADRYTYLPQIGLYIALAWGAERASRGWAYRRPVAGAVSALALMGLTCCAWQQVSYWKDAETLWRHALACTSNNYLAHSSMGIALAEHGHLDEAIAQYRTALEINPDYELAHYNLGLALAGRGEVEEALAHFRTALDIRPDHAAVLNNMAWILATNAEEKFRDGAEAVRLAQRANQLSPHDANGLDTLAAAYAEAGRFQDALAAAREALQLATAAGNRRLAESLRKRIELYGEGKPWRDLPPPKP